jgi:hypothetical protein
MGCLPFVFAAVAGACAGEHSGSTALGGAVFCGLCAVIFAVAHGCCLVADAKAED